MKLALILPLILIAPSPQPEVTWGNYPNGTAWVIATWPRGPMHEFRIYITTERR